MCHTFSPTQKGPVLGGTQAAGGLVFPHLGHVVQHGHAGHLLLDGSIRVDLAAKLGPVDSVVHLRREQTLKSQDTKWSRED